MKEKDIRTAVLKASGASLTAPARETAVMNTVYGNNIVAVYETEGPLLRLLIREQETACRLLEVIDRLLRIIEATKTERQ